jgi:hypothetical protein
VGENPSNESMIPIGASHWRSTVASSTVQARPSRSYPVDVCEREGRPAMLICRRLALSRVGFPGDLSSAC